MEECLFLLSLEDSSWNDINLFPFFLSIPTTLICTNIYIYKFEGKEVWYHEKKRWEALVIQTDLSIQYEAGHFGPAQLRNHVH